jgi:transcriptional regulator GlxA family with amidase domain
MIDVFFVVLPKTVLLDLAGPAEAFRIANQALVEPKFRLHYIGPQHEVDSSVGIGISNIQPLPIKFSETAEQTWVVLLGLPGLVSSKVMQQPVWQKTRVWLSKVLAPQLFENNQTHCKLLTVCVGALLAADAGLLTNRQCTTHHELLEQLETMAPKAKVVSNRVFVEDGPIFSSAGITAGIDLALHLIAKTCNAAIASKVAQTMVAFTRRGPLDTEQSPLLKFRDHLHPAIHRVQDAVCADPRANWTSADMAKIGFLTERHLLRLFTEHVGLTPRDFVQSVRCAFAEHALSKGVSAARAAELSGLQTARRLRDTLMRLRAASK